MSVGVIFYDDGLKNLYRKDVDIFKPIFSDRQALHILYSRFKDVEGVDGFVLLCPEYPKDSLGAKAAEDCGIGLVSYNISSVVEKPQFLLQQHWHTEKDDGCDTLIAEPLAEAVRQTGWDAVILIPLKNLLAEPKGVLESLELFFREKPDYLCSADRISGGGWWIFTSDLLLGLSKSNPEIAWVRGALAWALSKPLYPFKSCIYHCSRVFPRLKADLRLNSERSEFVYSKLADNSFCSPDFSYENWLNNSGWEYLYTDFAPADIFIEPTNRCDAACFGCPHSALNMKPTDMTCEVFSALTDSFVPGDDCRWVFSGMGEPLLHPRISEMVGASEFYHSSFITSLQIPFPKDFPFKSLNQIRVSLDTCSGEDLMKLRPGCSMKNVKDFFDLAAEARSRKDEYFPDVGVTMVRNGVTEALQQIFLSHYEKYIRFVARESYFLWPFDLPRKALSWYQILGESSWNGVSNKTSKVNFEPVKRRICKNALLGLYILCDGRVSLCPWDCLGNMTVGHLKQNSLKEIWNFDKVREFRKYHIEYSNELPEQCLKCSDWYHYL